MPMAMFMMENGRKEIGMEKVSLLGKMVVNMMENGIGIMSMDLELGRILMEMFMKVNGKKETGMDGESVLSKMEVSLKEILSMTNHMEKAHILILMEIRRNVLMQMVLK